MSADARAVRRGPSATGKRLVRKSIGRARGRSGSPGINRLGPRDASSVWTDHILDSGAERIRRSDFVEQPTGEAAV